MRARKLKLWNGRWERDEHIYVAAYSVEDVVALLTELRGYEGRGMRSEIRNYWHAGQWGVHMADVTPERGAWVINERTRERRRLTVTTDQQSVIRGPGET